jgi:hypothetical protein
MTIYSGNDYRKIYESQCGPIPKDNEGRAYEIHHIDGNHANVDISNLKCVTIQEHYNIHRDQEDWGACYAMAVRLKLSPGEISRLATLANLKRVADGTHPFVGDGEFQRTVQKNRIASGTHHFLDKKKARERTLKQVAEGIHNFLGGDISRKVSRQRVADGTHHFLGGALQRKQIADGTHNFLKLWRCEHCGKEGKNTTNYARWHGANCKLSGS